ncbi:translation initiation factor if-3 [Halobacteriovorax marinus SJ]|uniref:Translation initiation factor IF-3 n=1 Tax=Halobacteriovorax marinus (strain ATCC BAA-682 / DSM 15412 / SJ) TaxID=862908 RepID=E1X313_HALMS|nr:translation initiation factor IF-3 [Halobacteriovorax marinus]CBW26843.1 translation initiation factor if-3 [Halobacteriovorax marinus SJ]
MKDKHRGGRGKNLGPRINDQIRISECRLIGDDGTAYGVVSLDKARDIASDLGLDLVEVSPTAKPPVVKVIDYGKFKYDQQKKANEAKKKQAQVSLKEIQFRPNIEAHDLETKLKRAEKFLGQGDKIKMVMQFRGREMAYKDLGLSKFKDILATVEEMGSQVESEPKMMGNRIITIVAPTKKALQKSAATKSTEEAAES